jgi:hypothetical protein
MTHAKKIPPRCIAGRWGTVYATEVVVSKAGEDVLRPAFKSVLDGLAAKADVPVLPPITDRPRRC